MTTSLCTVGFHKNAHLWVWGVSNDERFPRLPPPGDLYDLRADEAVTPESLVTKVNRKEDSRCDTRDNVHFCGKLNFGKTEEKRKALEMAVLDCLNSSKRCRWCGKVFA